MFFICPEIEYAFYSSRCIQKLDSRTNGEEKYLRMNVTQFTSERLNVACSKLSIYGILPVIDCEYEKQAKYDNSNCFWQNGQKRSR